MPLWYHGPSTNQSGAPSPHVPQASVTGWGNNMNITVNPKISKQCQCIRWETASSDKSANSYILLVAWWVPINNSSLCCSIHAFVLNPRRYTATWNAVLVSNVTSAFAVQLLHPRRQSWPTMSVSSYLRTSPSSTSTSLSLSTSPWPSLWSMMIDHHHHHHLRHHHHFRHHHHHAGQPVPASEPQGSPAGVSHTALVCEAAQDEAENDR